MSGLVKPKDYDWKDSNLALFGSDTEKTVKKESAETEPAWTGAGAEPGLKIWRINKFKVEDWPEAEYGTFYNGDSYIILNTYKDEDSDALYYDVHFWIGKHSTQDEYGTAAYKTVELDTLLDDKPVQHREVQAYETDLFKSYFPNGITTLEGGCDTGFKHVEEETYTPRLLVFKKTGKVMEVNEIPNVQGCVNDEDVFILDQGKEIIQFNGQMSSPMERIEAAKYCQSLESERNGRASASVLDADDKRKFLQQIPEGEAEGYEAKTEFENKGILYKVSDADGSLALSEVINGGQIQRSDLDSNDVFIVHVGADVIVWVGGSASGLEKQKGLHYGDKYLREVAQCLYLSITVANEGARCDQLDKALAASCA